LKRDFAALSMWVPMLLEPKGSPEPERAGDRDRQGALDETPRTYNVRHHGEAHLRLKVCGCTAMRNHSKNGA
jgi:hypothetical protein